jgi:Oxidoreductase family, NAD-binding Rossmann fold
MVSEFEEAINVPGVEAVYICSPTDTHVDYVRRSVEAGKYVFCEKPIDLDLERAKACVQQLGDGATRVMMGFNNSTADLIPPWLLCVRLYEQEMLVPWSKPWSYHEIQPLRLSST